MMMLRELIRFSTQHRTLYCYMILSVWIFLLIAGMYKYIGQNSTSLGYTLNFLNGRNQLNNLDASTSSLLELRNLVKYKARCTPLTYIARADDGGILDGWKLQGVLLILRHGDRGPMSHVRPIPRLNCGITGDNLVNKYRSFLYNSTSVSGSNHMYWNKVGPFHGFPLLPLAEKECLLDEVVVYTTRVRRTFQSALAFLYTFLPTDKWLALNVKESHSIAFCFSDCACPQADALRKLLMKMQKQQLLKQTAITNIMQWIGSNLLQYTPNGITDANEVVDAILTIMCHDSPWPCRDLNITDNGAASTKANDFELNEVINIDQDDLGIASNALDIEMNRNRDTTTASTTGCIESSQVAALMSFVTLQSIQEARHLNYKRIGLLRAYGMIRHIVSYMLRMISGDRTKFVLYAGHDWTLQYLTAAFGIRTDNTFIAYAARLTIEVYRSDTHTDYYFRVVYNGRDVTQQIDFCEGGKSLRVTRDSRGNKADLCPIENIIRFLHEDYFAPLNATNFKDACM
uniref:2-phosphoxylose phosphatase 1 n=1 Tax=Glossina austeni TaxID=7395 RepID=A0A1A9VI53_GLOAU